MSVDVSNRVLWAVVLFGLAVAYVTIPKGLQEVKDAAKAPVPDPPPKSKNLDKDAEDRLKLETLRDLADGHSFGLRSSAIKIVAARVVKGQTRQLLLQDLTSPDPVLRDNAINGLWMLIYSPALSDKHLQDYFVDLQTFKAIITALINLLPLHKKPDPTSTKSASVPELPPSPIRPSNRPAHEVSLIIILTNLLRHQKHPSPFEDNSSSDSLATALKAGLVTRWLAHYPFPCALPENSKFNFKKSDVVNLFERKNWASDDMLMYEVIRVLTQSPLGLKQLRHAGLKASSYTENVERSTWDTRSWGAHDWSDEDMDVRMIGGETTAGIPSERWQTVDGLEVSIAPRPRSVERSQEEEQLRRRRREAIVVAEEGTPFRAQNILQRENSRVGPTPIHMGDNVTETDSMPDLESIADEFGGNEITRGPSMFEMPDLDTVPSEVISDIDAFESRRASLAIIDTQSEQDTEPHDQEGESEDQPVESHPLETAEDLNISNSVLDSEQADDLLAHEDQHRALGASDSNEAGL